VGKEFDQSGEKAFPRKGNPKNEEMASLKEENLRLKEKVKILKRRWVSRPLPELYLDEVRVSTLAKIPMYQRL
jgi:hypothetical protein